MQSFKYHLVLASGSPRRKELLAGLDIPFEVRVIPNVQENYPSQLPAVEVPEYIAVEKAEAYRNAIGDKELVLTADTVVVCEGQVLGKPKSAEQAADMLRLLSGKTHLVVTGVCLTTKNRQRHYSVKTEVTFKSLTEEEISYYITHYHPFDKAGAYGIQEWIGYIGCTGLKGSYYNVMGLPVQSIYKELQNFQKE
ncbi:MAG: Maf-like protein [Prevotella sp.]|jgi:septum formation protein|uniref:dTTP/UTP pyrophosphatase n=1 Tax=Segatella cerevisiae TaxID=2053716 RepID=A0ABT1BW36_9BACT|nr:Maf-like protein [Segatella cerevisiae]MCH3993686.1 Maf-like protein [Prevotella sp.]MCI1245937.1 Maf-like protein [Prevotella sp.]MCO6024613.1 Maf-like protein [Segatella cerevisiae]